MKRQEAVLDLRSVVVLSGKKKIYTEQGHHLAACINLLSSLLCQLETATGRLQHWRDVSCHIEKIYPCLKGEAFNYKGLHGLKRESHVSLKSQLLTVLEKQPCF